MMRSIILFWLLSAVPLRANTYNFLFPAKPKASQASAQTVLEKKPMPSASHSNWMLGIAGVMHSGRDFPEDYNNREKVSYLKDSTGLAGVLSYRILPALAVDLMLGMYKGYYSSAAESFGGPVWKILAAVDLHWLPVRLGRDDVALIELGFTSGVSNFGYEHEFMALVGLQANVNWTRTWATNLALRANRAANYGELEVMVRL